MIATMYGRGQMVIPAKVRKEAGVVQGDVFSVQTEGKGRIVLVRMEVPRPDRYRILRRKGKHPILVGGRPVTTAQVKALQEELMV